MDHCIVYFSRAVEPFDEAAIEAILQESYQNNTRLGITGVLLYVRGSVIQVLEGQQTTIEALYRRIEQDRRHTEVDQVLSRPIMHRLFGRWSMGYETLTARQLEQIRLVVDLDATERPRGKSSDHLLLRTIKLFYDSNRYN